MSGTTLPRYRSAWDAGAESIEEVLAWHRVLSGDLRMEDDPDGSDGDPDGDDESGRDGTDDDDTPDDDGEFEALPDDERTKVREAIRKVRDEAKRKVAREKTRAAQAEAEATRLRKAHETEQEKAVREAREEGRREAATDTAAAMLRMALKANGVTDDDDLADAVDDFNLAGAIGDDGSINDDRITRYAGRFGKQRRTNNDDAGDEKQPPRRGDAGHSSRQQRPPAVSAKDRAKEAATRMGWVTPAQ